MHVLTEFRCKHLFRFLWKFSVFWCQLDNCFDGTPGNIWLPVDIITRYFENDTFMGRKWAPGYGACARKKICHCGKQMDWECRENNWRPVSNFVITPWPFYNFFVERVENSASRFVVSIPDCLFRLPQTGELDKNKVSLLQFVQLFLILRRALFRWLLWKEENGMTSTFLTPSSL